MGTQCSSLMLGSMLSSNTPNDFQPNSHKGSAARPLISRHSAPAPPEIAYSAEGIQPAGLRVLPCCVDRVTGMPIRSGVLLKLPSVRAGCPAGAPAGFGRGKTGDGALSPKIQFLLMNRLQHREKTPTGGAGGVDV